MSQTNVVSKFGPNMKRVFHFWTKPETFFGLKVKYRQTTRTKNVIIRNYHATNQKVLCY